MERRLYEAAVEGNVSCLLNLLQEDAVIIDRYIVGCFMETPLHIALMLGHVEFSLELLKRKPELATELNCGKASPLHLASAKRGCTEIVKALLSIEPAMCFARDRDGRNPLHVAAIKGRVCVLKELVQAQPDAARALLDQGQTILHLCVQYNQLEALKLLVENMDDPELLNSKDNDGNTILHLAVADKQIETISFLVSCTGIEVNAPNLKGFTAMDILECLQVAGALKSPDIPNLSLPANQLGSLKSKASGENSRSEENNRWEHYFEKQEEWLDKQRNGLMVVASLIATMAFQVGVSPPGGFWQDKNGHEAGRSILADEKPDIYRQFILLNTTVFITSLSIILLLISGLPLRRRWFMWFLMLIMWLAVTFVALTYATSIEAFTTSDQLVRVSGMVVTGSSMLYALMVLLLLVHTIRLILTIAIKSKRFITKKREQKVQRRLQSA